MPNPDDQTLVELLANASNIALVGHSANPEKASFRVSRYLRDQGYAVFPVNPALEEVDGLKVYRNLAEIPQKIDIVDVFRKSEFLAEITREAVAI
jgi:predicted CoA-binding protein